MRKIVFSFFLMLMMLLTSGIHSSVSAAEVKDMRWVTRNDAAVPFVRIVLDLDKPVKATASIDSTGLTTVVTLKNTNMESAPKRMTLNQEIAIAATAAKVGKDLRLTIQTPKALDVADVSVFPLKADKANKKPPRLVIDIKKKGLSRPVKPARYKVTPGLGDKVIVIDPGHGGSDPGAIGPNKVMEKSITLDVAYELKERLEAKGARVYMTRTGDRDVYKPRAEGVDELQARVDIAEKYDADVFLSLHVDAFVNPEVGGATTYYNGKTPFDKVLAGSIIKYIGSIPGFAPSRGVKSANFYVMKNSSMPTSLIEMGFLSNPKEEKLLTQEETQEAFAKGIADGVEEFFRVAKR